MILAESAGEDITDTVDKTEEMGKSIFGFWFSVSPGETKTAEITYKLPIKLDSVDDYELVIQKQPGTLPEDLKIQIGDKILYEGLFDQTEKTIE